MSADPPQVVNTGIFAGYQNVLVIDSAFMEVLLRLTRSTAPTRRYPVCFPLILYYDATLPMLD